MPLQQIIDVDHLRLACPGEEQTNGLHTGAARQQLPEQFLPRRAQAVEEVAGLFQALLRPGLVEQLQHGALGHGDLQRIGQAGRRGQGLVGQRGIGPVEQVRMDVACRKARSEPGRQLVAAVAPQDQRVAAEVVAHALQAQRALAADVQARHALLQELQRPVDAELVVREGVDAVGQAHEPAALGIARGELGRHPQRRQGGQVERRTTWQRGLQPLDYLMP